MKALFIENPIEVSNELEELALDREGLLGVVEKVVTARNNCTSNDTPAAPGTQAYLTGTRAMRDEYCPRGWEKCEDHGMACIFHRDRKIKVIMVNTDEATGLNVSDRTPKNRNEKGPATDRAVTLNQLSFQGFEVAENIIRMDQQGGIQHWFLMVYAEGDIYRAELSYPETFKGGFFRAFRKRIILVGGEFGGDGDNPVKRRDNGPDAGVEITVTRKQA